MSNTSFTRIEAFVSNAENSDEDLQDSNDSKLPKDTYDEKMISEQQPNSIQAQQDPDSDSEESAESNTKNKRRGNKFKKKEKSKKIKKKKTKIQPKKRKSSDSLCSNEATLGTSTQDQNIREIRLRLKKTRHSRNSHDNSHKVTTRTSSELYKVQFKKQTVVIPPFDQKDKEKVKQNQEQNKSELPQSNSNSKAEDALSQKPQQKEVYKITQVSTTRLVTKFDKNGKMIEIKNLMQAENWGTDPAEDTTHKIMYKRKVFHKLEKFYRLRRLERKLGIFNDDPKNGKVDPEKHLKAYMTSWEGVKPNEQIGASSGMGAMMGQYPGSYDNTYGGAYGAFTNQYSGLGGQDGFYGSSAGYGLGAGSIPYGLHGSARYAY